MGDREALAERDGAACVWCGREPWRADLTLEHLLPRSRGGRGGAENLVLACRRCNRARRSRAVSAYVRTLLGEGRSPRLDVLDAALARLEGSAHRAHREYGAGQRALLRRVGG